MIIVSIYNSFMIQIRSKIAINILGYFFINPSRFNYVNELAKILEADPGNLYRKLIEMEKEGILISEERGNQKYYGLNKRYPLLKELKRSYEAKYGMVNLLKEKLSKLENLNEAYIFGSYAAGNFGQESDVDILLIGDHSPLEAKRTILPLQKVVGREINIIDISEKELKSRKKTNDDFIKNIFSKKTIKLI